METKVCKKCCKEKNVADFRQKKVNEYKYYYSYCRDCEREINREYLKEHCNKRKEYMKEYRQENKDKINKKRREYRQKNREKVSQQSKASYERNKEKRKVSNKEYRRLNKEKINKQVLKRKQEEPLIHLKSNIRNTILRSFKVKGKSKSKRTEEILGISLDNFYNYLLQTYQKNYGVEWDGIEKVHIDHIVPLKICSTEKDIIKSCHYTNLQLLKAKDNLQKGDKLNWELTK